MIRTQSLALLLQPEWYNNWAPFLSVMFAGWLSMLVPAHSLRPRTSLLNRQMAKHLLRCRQWLTVLKHCVEVVEL
jgi:hypothetical protein